MLRSPPRGEERDHLPSVSLKGRVASFPGIRVPRISVYTPQFGLVNLNPHSCVLATVGFPGPYWKDGRDVLVQRAGIGSITFDDAN